MDEDPSDWRMDAYYYGFGQTGNNAIDRILSAVACAGKSYHHTDSWTDDCEPYPHLRGNCCADWIQNAAADAATACAAAVEAMRLKTIEDCEAIARRCIPNGYQGFIGDATALGIATAIAALKDAKP